MTGIENAGTV